MKESERKEKKRETGELEASPPKKFIAELIDVHLLQTEAYIFSEKGKLQNNMKQQNYNEDILGRNKKSKSRKCVGM